ncbi:MAG: hypothetical protein WAL30_01035 [Candidatus Aquirickettsiella sp.]
MANNLNKKNLFLEHKIDSVVDSVEDDEGGGGTITLSVEEFSAYLQALFNKERRQRIDGQRKFGVCPFSEDPNNLLGKKISRSCGFGESPQLHPLLAHSQQFSGDDPSISANPIENSEAKERFPEKRLENQLRLQKNLGLSASKNVTLAR